MKKKLPGKKKLLPPRRNAMPVDELVKNKNSSKHDSNQVEVVDFKIEYLPLDKLKLWGKNPRINEKGAVRLAELIRKNRKFVDPIVIDQNGVIRAGNTRYKAAKILKLKTVPCVRVNWEKEGDAILYAISNNKAHEFTGWDPDILAEAFNHKEVLGFDVTGMSGFSDKELRGINWEPSDEFMDGIEGTKRILKGIIRIKCPKERRDEVWQKVAKFVEALNDREIEVLL